jgi:hypothetical protein
LSGGLAVIPVGIIVAVDSAHGFETAEVTQEVRNAARHTFETGPFASVGNFATSLGKADFESNEEAQVSLIVDLIHCGDNNGIDD